MIEGVVLIEQRESGEQVPLGRYDFLTLPFRGNRVVLANKIGGLAAYDVVATEHSPIESGDSGKEESKFPWCVIYLKMSDPMFDVYLGTAIGT